MFPLLGIVSGTQLAYDFDFDNLNQGPGDPPPPGETPDTDPFGFYFGIDDLGVGTAGHMEVQEVMGSNGDSGGPAFIDGKIAGVASWRLGLSMPPDIDAFDNSTFGEVGSDTRVSSYAGWIDSLIDIVPPRVTSLKIGTSLQLHDDYAVPSGSGEQLRTVPVGGANQILIGFSDPVGVTQADLSLLGAFTGTAYDVLAPGNSFNYNAITRTATWTFADEFPPDQMELTLSDTVAGAAGVPLDGDWINPIELADTDTSSFMTGSGDGTFGGDFMFRFTILPGDVNRDNVVDIVDLNVVRNNFGMTMAAWTDGDTSGNLVVDIDDLNNVRNNFGKIFTSWPGGAQAATSGGGSEMLSAAGEDGFLLALAQLYATDSRKQAPDDPFWQTLADDDFWGKVLDEIRAM